MGNFIEDIIDKDLSEGKVNSITTRFPPEPNGYLHIGHAKAIILNSSLAKKYGGKFNLRFDDTNPVKEEEEYVNSIIADVKWLTDFDDIYYASDYFPVMRDCAVKLIEKGKAYVDDITAEEMRQNRGTLTQGGVESKNRNRPIAESLKLFKDMEDGLVTDGALVLRAKIDMSSPNINMRDPIIYRVLKAHHHRQGDKWNIYPMYDFAHPIEDAVEGVTHSICTLEFEDHRPLYDWVLNECGFVNPPHQYEFARLNITRSIMSKRYLKKLVDEKFVDGWDDPRMPTLAGLKRRGYTPSAIREFCERIGVSKANSEVDAAQLESCIREEFNASAERVMAVLEPLSLEIVNRPDGWSEEVSVDINPNNPDSGKRTISLTKNIYIEQSDFMINPPPKYHRLVPDGMVRLKSGYIIKCVGYDLNDGGDVKKVKAEIIEGTKSGEDNSGVKVKGVIHWVNDEAIDIEARIYDYLLTADDDKMDFSERLNRNSLIIRSAKAEKYLADAKAYNAYQFVRQGYFCRDPKRKDNVFNMTVGLKDSFNKK